MAKSKRILTEICLTKLDALEIPKKECKDRCIAVIPFQLELILAEDYAHYAIQRTEVGEYVLDRSSFEYEVIQKDEWAQDIASRAIHQTLMLVKTELSKKPKAGYLTKLVSMINDELEKHVRKLIASAIAATSTGAAYVLDKEGVIDVSGTVKYLLSLIP